MTKIQTVFLAFVVAGAVTATAFADGGYGNRNSRLDPYHQLIEAEKYAEAIDKLQAALSENADDADLLNLLAFSQRKLGRFDEAMVNYQQALKLEPRHLGANEYLGELYLQLDQPEKAEERLQVLDKACFFGCREYDKLEQAIAEYRQSKM
jgi:tetratricopeptide (TPR) repeat protein